MDFRGFPCIRQKAIESQGLWRRFDVNGRAGRCLNRNFQLTAHAI